MIKDIYDLCIHLNTTVDSIVRDIYDSTECDAWIFWDDKAVTIGSIFGGSDAEFSRTFDFPFHENAFDSWVELLEEMANEAWREANDDLGGRDINMLTRKEILDRNKKYRVSDRIKNKAHKRGFRIRIKYSFDDECYYVTLINSKNGAEETFYVGLLFMIEHERPFDEVIINMMNNIFLRTVLGRFRGDVE